MVADEAGAIEATEADTPVAGVRMYKRKGERMEVV